MSNKPLDTMGLGFLIFWLIGAVIMGVGWVYTTCQDYNNLEIPYRFVAEFYYYLFFFPIYDVTMLIFNGITMWIPYNIGWLIAILVSGSYVLVLLWLVVSVFVAFVWLGVFYILPLLFISAWWVFDVILSWLFSA